MSEPGSEHQAVFGVVIADDDGRIRDELGSLIDEHPSFRLLDSADNGIDAARLCRELRPSLVILDVMMPSGGFEALAEVRRWVPETTVAFYTAQGDRRNRRALLDAGADAVFVKGAAIDLASELLSLLIGPAD